MTDDEVKQWLDNKERWAFDASERAIKSERAGTTNPDGTASRTYLAGPWHATVAALRSLAETRKALWSLEWKGDCLRCPCCFSDRDDEHPHGGHKPDCVFATMPRPQSNPTSGRIDTDG